MILKVIPMISMIYYIIPGILTTNIVIFVRAGGHWTLPLPPLSKIRF